MLRHIKCTLLAVVFLSAVSAAQQKTVLELKTSERKLPFGLTEQVPDALPKIGLALSGGGSRSVSELGVLHALEENKIPVEYIVGTSMGGVLGGLYSAGYSLAELDSIVLHSDWPDFFALKQSDRNELFVDQKITEDKALLTFRLDGLKLVIPKSINTGQKVANFLNLLTLNAPLNAPDNFDDLLYKFRAVSTNLVTGKPIVLDSGSLSLAMRASSSVTLLLPPVVVDSTMMVDGGLVENIPVSTTKSLGADMIVAVDASSPLHNENELVYPWVIADQLVSIPMKLINSGQKDLADFVIEPRMDGVKNNDFSGLNALVDSGYSAALRMIPEIKEKIETEFKKNIGGGEVFYKNLSLAVNPSRLEIKFFDEYLDKDSVSNKDILFGLCNFQKDGFYKSLRAEISEGEGGGTFRLAAAENPVVRNLVLNGVTLIGKISAHAVFSPVMGKPYSAKQTLKSLLNLLRLYKLLGYSLAHINSLSFDGETGTLSVDVHEGIIENIIVTGNEKTKEQVITREFPLEPGEVFVYSKALEGLTNLSSTNLFDQVDLTVERNNGSDNLVLNVDEKISSVLRFGTRIDNENQTQVSLDIRDENLFGSGTEIGMTLSGGARNRSFVLEQKANRIFNSYLTYKIRAFYEFNDVNVYSNDVPAAADKFSRSKTGEYRQIFYGGSFGVGTQVEKFGNLIVEARYQRDEIKGKSDYSGPVYKTDISSLRALLTIDSQDRYPFPSNGFLVKTIYETAQTAFGGDVGFTKFSFDYKGLLSLSDASVLSGRLVLGYADRTLPLSEQFSIGGQNSFFGMRDYEYRGRQIFQSSLEYRFKLPVQLFFDTYLRARYDLGWIWEEKEQIRFKDLHHGVGFTLSLDTPIGPADFSVGRSFYFKGILSRNAISRGPVYFYFTIGYYY